MREPQTLAEWSNHYHSQKEFQKTFYIMDQTMKKIHDNRYYITSFNPNNIAFYYEKEEESPTVEFKKVIPFDRNNEEEIKQNIYNLAFLEIGIYSDTLAYITPEFVKNNFHQFKVFIPQEDVFYYQKILTQNIYSYYSDYIKKKNEQEIESLNKSLEQEQSSSGSIKGNQKMKATNAGKVFTQMNQEENNNNMAAFTTRFILPFLLITASLLIPLIAWFYTFAS